MTDAATGHHFGEVERQNRLKNYQVMATQRVAKSGWVAHFEPISGYFSRDIFEDKDLIFVFPDHKYELYLNSDGKPNFKQIGLLKLAILSHKNLYLATSWKLAPRKTYLFLRV